MRALLLLPLLSACGGEGEDEIDVCYDMCSELVMTCSFAAYPDMESCRQGCMWDAELGANVNKEFLCIRDAECDLFTIVECEHHRGESAQ